ncbi:MAG: acyl-CoA dehydrogenase family protein, partial [Dehalococcoidia bacterium]|nr:acyl-CoA dehydrogenase family protein [Dehalococcoidia bacterium]
TQRFIDDDLRPLEERAAAGEIDGAAVRRAVIERSRELEFFGMTQPADFGGSAAGPMELTVVREALAAANLGVARSVFGPGPGVLARAEGPLRERYLEPLMRGELRASFAFTEPSDGSLPTSAKRDGDDFVIDGRKAFVSGGGQADFYEVMLNVEEDAGGPGGGAMLIVDRDAPGLSRGDDFTSLDGSTHCQLIFESMRVPQTNIVGSVGEGIPRALGNIGRERLQIAAQASGTAMWAVDFTRQHISQPHRSGTPLGDREQVRAIFAQMVIDAYTIRSVLYRTARMAAAGDDIINEAGISKVVASEGAGRIVDQAIQLTGAMALVEGHPLERLYRLVRTWRLAGGASDLLRLNVARGMLEFDAGRV